MLQCANDVGSNPTEGKTLLRGKNLTLALLDWIFRRLSEKCFNTVRHSSGSSGVYTL